MSMLKKITLTCILATLAHAQEGRLAFSAYKMAAEQHYNGPPEMLISLTDTWGTGEWIAVIAVLISVLALIISSIKLYHRCRPIQFFVSVPIRNSNKRGFVIYTQNRSDKPTCFAFYITKPFDSQDTGTNTIFQRIEEKDAEYLEYWLIKDTKSLMDTNDYNDKIKNFIALKDTKKTENTARAIPLTAGHWAIIAVETNHPFTKSDRKINFVYTHKRSARKTYAYIPKTFTSEKTVE